MKLVLRRILIASGAATLTAGFFVVAVIAHVQFRYLDHIYTTPSDIPDKKPIAIVLGAAILRDGRPSDALRDRLLTGEKLYRDGKVEKILVTGDDGQRKVNEVTVMKNFLLAEGIPEDALLVDGHGYRTYESCKRAKEVFNITEAVVVTQRFHLARALYLCNSLGVESVGLTADIQTYVKIVYFWQRDLLSSAKAWWDIHIDAPSSPVEQKQGT